MPFTTGSFESFMKEAQTKILKELRNQSKGAVHKKFVDVRTTDTHQNKDQDMESMGMLNHWPENTPRPEMAFYEGWPQVYSQTQFGGLVDITKAMIKFGRYDLIRKLTQHLVRSSAKTKDIIFAAYLEYGDVAMASVPAYNGVPLVNTKGGDSLTLFNTAHKWRSTDQHTWGNLMSSHADLTRESIISMNKLVRRWTDNTGSPLDLKLRGVVVPSELVDQALEVFKSKNQPENANNAVNTAPLVMEAQEIVEYQWLQSQTAWYGLTNADIEDGLHAFYGWDNEVETGDANKNPRTGNRCISIDFSVSHGANLLRRMVKMPA
ncbi:MAG: Mu-like prophage major head subunit gpT family protein [Bryobacteraceae bacterium]